MFEQLEQQAQRYGLAGSVSCPGFWAYEEGVDSLVRSAGVLELPLCGPSSSGLMSGH